VRDARDTVDTARALPCGTPGPQIAYAYDRLEYVDTCQAQTGETIDQDIQASPCLPAMSPMLGHRPSLWSTHKENGP
jgi:hypothetical protein